MKRLKLTLIALAFIAFGTTASADDTDYFTLEKFATALRTKDYKEAEKHISSGSGKLFQRYTDHDLGDLTPESFTLLSQKKTAKFRYLKIASTDAQGKPKKATTVAMVSENNVPKIDLPETLRYAFGPKWEQKVNVIEQSYMFAQQQFGEAESRKLLESMLQKRQ